MAERRSLSNKIRFEVFKRDSFTCQYCGKKAPDVVLNVDHIKPVADGGTNDIFNLITSCFECNNGKRDIPLDKQKELDKQRESLEILEERRKQLDMLFKWKTELTSVKNYELEKMEQFILDTYDVSLTDSGKNNLQKYIKEFGINEVMESTQIAFDQYDSFEKAFNYIPRICNVRKQQQDHPEYKDIYYLSKIAESNCAYYSKHRVINFLKAYYTPDDFDYLKMQFSKLRNWTELRDLLESYYGVEL